MQSVFSWAIAQAGADAVRRSVAYCALSATCLACPTSIVSADIQMPVANPAAPIWVTGRDGLRWQEGLVEVLYLRECVIRQDQVTLRANQGVLWVDRATMRPDQAGQVTVYLEGQVAVDYARGGDPHRTSGNSAQSIRDRAWFGRLASHAGVEVNTPVTPLGSMPKPSLVERGKQAWNAATGEVQLTQFSSPPAGGLPPPAETIGPAPLAPLAATSKRLQILPRGNAAYQIKMFPGSQPDRSVTVFSNGIRAIVEGVEAPQIADLGRVVIETDRLVVWGPKLKKLTGSNAQAEAGEEIPIELYMEGNIVFRQGDRLIYADRMYYNATQEYGAVLEAEMYTPVPDFEGMVRLKADVLHQLNRQFFQAYGAAVTSSQMGVPQYWLQSQSLTLEDQQRPRIDPITGQYQLDLRTGEPAVEHDLMAKSHNNFLYVGGVPLLYWPVIATNLRQPNYYLERFSLKNDNVFGTQVLADWNMYQLLGIRRPWEGSDWTVSTDWLSDRGIGLGTTFDYDRPDAFGFTGPVRGRIDAWGIRDTGFDNLGADRRRLTPEEELRGRLFWRHRQDLSDGYQFTGQFGWITDRNFQEQYYEREWDEWKDQVTSLELKQTVRDQSWRILGQVRLNEFFAQTDWLPRFDHFLVGRSLLYDHLTWYAHSQVGYAHLHPATAPQDPADAANWAPLPWEQDTEGLRAASRQEIDLPLQLGPVKFVPYLLGEVAYWRETLNGQTEVTRALGQIGLRTSLPIWKANPTVHSTLWNLDGLAHKVSFDSDLYWADANEDLNTLPLYDPIQDDSQEHFLRRLTPIPARYDDRLYLYRSGIQGWVTSPSTEIVDDAAALRTGIHQRWQTKRGLPGQQRVIDWISFDVDTTFYANADRDNFGEYLGQLEYDFRWHVGDRLTFLSDGFSDFFDGGMRAFSFGAAISRPERGRLYAGVMSIEGPFTSSLLVSSLSYRLSQKWIAEMSASYDLGPTGRIGERIAITRIGESVLVRIGFYSDHSRDNVGFQLAIEPRFLPNRRLGRAGAVSVAPVGAYGLE